MNSKPSEDKHFSAFIQLTKEEQREVICRAAQLMPWNTLSQLFLTPPQAEGFTVDLQDQIVKRMVQVITGNIMQTPAETHMLILIKAALNGTIT